MLERYMRPSTEEDCAYVASNIRPEDREEVVACGFDPFPALMLGLIESQVSYTLIGPDGLPCAMLGVVPGGRVWLLGTPGIETHSRTFLRYSKQALAYLYERTGEPLLHNYTHAANKVHHRWLKWLGFSFLRTVSINDHNFIEFARFRS